MILGIEDLLASLEECIQTKFILSITGGHLVDEEERFILSLPPPLGSGLGSGLKNPIEAAPTKFMNARKVTKELQLNITKLEAVVTDQQPDN